MSGNMSRNKGQRGEREVVKLLQPIVDKVYGSLGLTPPVLERNLMQSHKGGFDIAGLHWMALEVKYQETLNVGMWWNQTLAQANVDINGNPLRKGQPPVPLSATGLPKPPVTGLDVSSRENELRSGVKRAGREPDQMLIPILMYRSNGAKWRVRMFAGLYVGAQRVRTAADVEIGAFLVWFELQLAHVLKTSGLIPAPKPNPWAQSV